jgi:uncharacterized protein (DUF2141 family)
MKRRISLRLVALLLAAPFVLFGCGGDDDNTQEPTNRDPQITSVTVSPASVVAGGSATVTVTAIDQDGDALTYTYQPNGGSISGAGASVTWNAPTTAGPYSVTVTVSDGNGGTATSTGNLSVIAGQTGISGTAQATAGVQIDLRNSRVAIYADYNDWVMDQYVMTATGTGNEYAVSFSFTGVAPGTYYLDLWKDMDNSASYTAGDLFGFYGTGAWPANINFTPITVLQGQITNIGSIWVLEL